MTKYDYFIQPYVEHIANFLRKYFISNSSAYGNALEDFEKKLDETKEMTPKKPVKKTNNTEYLERIERENHDQYSTLRFYRQKKITTQKYVIAPKELNLQYPLNIFDTAMPLSKLVSSSYFLNSRNSCKLASVFGGIPIGHNRLRKNKNVCSNVNWSCCTGSTFRNFKYNANLGMSRLKSYYYNKFRIDLWFLLRLEPGKKDFKMSPYKAFNVACQGTNNLAKCNSLVANIKSARIHSIMYFQRYVKDYSKCIKSMESLRSSLRCASCDAENMYLINDQEKIVYLKKASMNKIIKSCYNYDLYRSNLLQELYTAYLNYAKQVDPTILLQSSEFDDIFDQKVGRCAYWLEFTRSNYGDDLTRSRECIDYG